MLVVLVVEVVLGRMISTSGKTGITPRTHEVVVVDVVVLCDVSAKLRDERAFPKSSLQS